MKKASAFRFIASAFALVGLLFAAPTAEAQPSFGLNPVIFVHGFVGSGAQFESQKMRFTSNRYPESHIAVLDYDSTFATETRQQIYARLDQLIADLKQQTGQPRVELLGHSLGTELMQEYLNSSPARAANVSHYVNIDGREADAPPGGVPTLAIWAGRGNPGREIVGATNVTIPNQTHVQAATSEESFAEFYKFFVGRKPPTTRIRRGRREVTVAGRALLFPNNQGLLGATVELWELDRATGHRVSSDPVATFPIDASGDWGPVTIKTRTHYEFVRLRPGVPALRYYYEPFVRSDHLVRLLDSDALNALVEKSASHVAMVFIRYKELWGDQGSESDILAIDGTNVCNAATCPISQQVNAVFAFDRGSDGQTDLSAPHPVFSQLPFITGVDIFVPAATPPTGTVSMELRSRGARRARTLNFPNLASTVEGVVVQLRDFERPRR